MRNLVKLLRRHRRILIPIETLALVFCVFMLLRSSDDSDAEETIDESFMEDSDVLDELTGVSEADQEEAGSVELTAPKKADVTAMREIVLDGMSEEEMDTLCSLIKEANTEMESLIIYDNFFSRLSDPDDLKWNYFDESGEIQIGWATGDDEQTIQEIMDKEGLTKAEYYEKYGSKVVAENKYSAEEFAQLLEEIQVPVLNEALKNDLQQIIDEVRLAAETHDVEHAEKLYYLLHDMDYFLLNYRLDTEGQYVKDKSTISQYYGVLSVYD